MSAVNRQNEQGNLMRRFSKMLIGAALTVGATLSPALAQTFPNKPITMIVPFAPGGSSDIIARIVAEEMGLALKERIVIENVAGAGGAVGFARLANSPADGYSIAVGNAGTSAATYTLEKTLKFTPEAFEAIGMVAKTIPVIALKKDSPHKDLKNFLEFAKQNPGKLTLGHAGIGSSNYLICKLFLQAAKVKIELAGYRGAGPALNDAVGGHLDGICDGATSVASSINGDKITGLVVASKVRSPTLPQVPTAIEAGLPEFVQEGWNAILAPKGLPAPTKKILNDALRTALASPRIKLRYDELSTLVTSGQEHDPAFTDAFIASEIVKYRELLQ
jgi:tripartite-type tricarboxylate transporter receptor subunit TctC